MRTIFFLLLLANLTLFGYTHLDARGTGEAVRLEQQVKPDMIKLLTPQQVAALAPSKVSALADVCMEWGPLSDGDRSRAMTELEPLALGRLLTQKRTEINATHYVHLPRNANKATIDKRVADLSAAGLRNVTVIDSAAQRYTISLGAFKSEEAANAYLGELSQKGITDATVEPRAQVLPQTVLVVRDPEANVVSRLKTLQTTYPETETRIGPCDKTT
jgi:hypothetical protein